MAKDQSFEKFAKARAKYRDGVVKQKFDLYTTLVTAALSDPKPILAAAEKQGSLKASAVAQQAADLMMASKRAQDMRSRTHLDYIESYKAAVPFQDRSEEIRVKRHQEGRY